MRWTTLRQERGQAVPEFTNTFHTLRTKLGIKDSEKHLVLKYHGALHRYIQTCWRSEVTPGLLAGAEPEAHQI
jgi:hypothetical protein